LSNTNAATFPHHRAAAGPNSGLAGVAAVSDHGDVRYSPRTYAFLM
jgi:hypothetical protein